MSKWADYLITKVKYDGNGQFLIEVEVREDKCDKVGDPQIKSRKNIISARKVGTTFITSYIEKDGDKNVWKKGANVEIIKVDGEEYLRTDKNKLKKDNLGELPELD